VLMKEGLVTEIGSNVYYCIIVICHSFRVLTKELFSIVKGPNRT
jgi:hypothetical protein